MLEQQRVGGPAVVVVHCALDGRLETPVRGFHVDAVAPYAQYPCAVRVSFQRPRERRWSSVIVKPDNMRYLTIEVGGQIVYDSRPDVPCDMAAWNALDAECRTRRGRTEHHL